MGETFLLVIRNKSFCFAIERGFLKFEEKQFWVGKKLNMLLLVI